MEYSTTEKAFILTPQEAAQLGCGPDRWPDAHAQELLEKVSSIIGAAITADMDLAHAGIQRYEHTAANQRRLQLLEGMRSCIVNSGVLDLSAPNSPKGLLG